MKPRLIIGALLLSASSTLFAQTPGSPDGKEGPPGGHRAMRPCAQEANAAQCESRRKEFREHLAQAREACKGKAGSERGQCMTTQICAKAPDPAKCQERAKERAGHFRDRHEKGAAQVAPKS